MMSVLLSIAAAWLALAAVSPAAAQPPPAPGPAPWGYTGNDAPDTWATSYPDCGGSHQSPIDIPYTGKYSALPSISPPLVLAGKCKVTDFQVLSHDFKWVYASPDSCTAAVGTDAYNLLQVHVHAPSEHTINGKHAGAELHFVHTSPSSVSPVQYRVVGVLLEASDTAADNKWIAKMFAPLPGATYGQANIRTTIAERANLLPAHTKWFNYAGSLTTPPCTEAVDWWLAAKPVVISSAQLALLQERQSHLPDDNQGTNDRPTQALNGREIKPLKS